MLYKYQSAFRWFRKHIRQNIILKNVCTCVWFYHLATIQMIFKNNYLFFWLLWIHIANTNYDGYGTFIIYINRKWKRNPFAKSGFVHVTDIWFRKIQYLYHLYIYKYPILHLLFVEEGISILQGKKTRQKGLFLYVKMKIEKDLL